MRQKKCCAACLCGASAVLALTLLTRGAIAQGPTFSVDYQGPTAGFVPGPFTGVLDGFGIGAIDEGSILTTAPPGVPGPNPPLPGPLPPPGIMVGSIAGAPGSIPGGLGLVPPAAAPFPVELDALSYGRDSVQPVVVPGGPASNVPFFSVDEFAVGVPTGIPDVFSEGAAGMLEAAADVFRYVGPYGPIVPGPVFGNLDILDGDGLAPFGGPGTGLIEPNAPTVGNHGGDVGDNLDAVDLDSTFNDVAGLIYFSLDSNFPDPLEVAAGGFPPPNTGTAFFNGFVGGDVLVTTPGAAPAVYAPAAVLGLDIAAGPDSDDLDALALMDNGDGIPAVGEPGSGLDEILFSVRRNSAVIGMPDSLFGAPIEEGDILTVPLPTALGGVSPFPQIFIAAEALGLTTVRSGTAIGYGVPNPLYQGQDLWADDLDALDVFAAIPEPSSMLLMLVGLTAVSGLRRKRIS